MCENGNQNTDMTKYLCNQVKKILESRSLNLSFKNPNQVSNDGMKLEAIVSGSFVRASRSSGVGGIDLISFITEFLSEVTGITCHYTGSFTHDSYSIPFLSTPNVPFPDFILNIDDTVNIKNAERTKNDERVDFATADKSFTAEVKDYTGKLDSKTFQKVLARVPVESLLHLVITNQLQSQYQIKYPKGKESKREKDEFQAAKNNYLNRNIKQITIKSDGSFDLDDVDITLIDKESSSETVAVNHLNDKQPLVILISLVQESC